MSEENIQETIKKLIREAQSLVGVPPTSPKYLMWRNRAEAFIGKNYDDKTGRVFQKCLRATRVFRSQQDLQIDFNQRLESVVEFFDELSSTPPNIKRDAGAVSAGTLNSLHPTLVNKCSSLYSKGEYVEAVEKGFKVVKDRLRELTGFESGSDAFGRGKLYINGAAAKNVDSDFQQASKFLTMAIDSFRNEKSHTSDGKIDNPIRAYEYLATSSLAMHLLDDSSIQQNI